MGATDVPPELAGLSGLYNSEDPLLRRLRLEDPNGHAILDINKYFAGKEVVVLYAGSEGGANNLKELHRSLTALALTNFKTVSVIYVSIDTDPESPKRITKDVPWLRMTFNDNSDFAPVARAKDQAKIVEIEDVERGEDFIQGGEIEVGAEKVDFGVEEYERDYVRPLSRAGVTALMQTYTTPSLAVYNILDHKFVAKHVRPSEFSPDRVSFNLNLWRNGKSSTVSFKRILLKLKWSLFALFLAILYRLVIAIGGQQYHVIPELIHKLSWRSE